MKKLSGNAAIVILDEKASGHASMLSGNAATASTIFPLIPRSAMYIPPQNRP